MNKELRKRLVDEYPFMKIYGEMPYIECDDGWFYLLYKMADEIKKVYEEADKEIDIIFLQMKEKYGTLRCYYVFDIYHKDHDKIHDKVGDIIEKYENISDSVCEVCGNKGYPTVINGWIKTLCVDHQKVGDHS